MKQEWPTITLADENDEVKARGGDDFPGDERDDGRARTPGAPGRRIENEDPNAAENKPESGH